MQNFCLLRLYASHVGTRAPIFKALHFGTRAPMFKALHFGRRAPMFKETCCPYFSVTLKKAQQVSLKHRHLRIKLYYVNLEERNSRRYGDSLQLQSEVNT
jgi:hypothetical protein